VVFVPDPNQPQHRLFPRVVLEVQWITGSGNETESPVAPMSANVTLVLCCCVSSQSEDTPLQLCNDHLDCGVILKHLHKLEELQLVYGYVAVTHRCTVGREEVDSTPL